MIDIPNLAADLEGFRAVFEYVLLFFIGYYLIEDHRKAIQSLHLISAVATLAALVGFAQVAMGVETPSSWTDAAEQGIVRAFSFVVSPNVLGSYMALMIPIAVALFFYEKNVWLKGYYAFASLLQLGAFVLSGSRGAWLALLLSLLLIFALINWKWALGGGVAAVLGGFLLPPIRSRILNLLSPEYLEKSASDGRIARWLGAYHEMRFDPFFGRGIGHYGGAVGDRYFGTTYVDSYYFKTLAELGLPGVLLLAWLLFSVGFLLYQLWHTTKGKREFFLLGGILIGLIAVIFHNGVENIFEVPFMNSYFWFLTGLMLSYPYWGEHGKMGTEALSQERRAA
ncbi:conserved membrane hypothetical protein [[Clostridium] ultunense Esp]|nr:conserved membrane hypothetical protein [[Clostridium] ultunense Esp]